VRVVLFTPVSEHSAIARVAYLLAGALRARGEEVVIVSTDDQPVPADAVVADFGHTEYWRNELDVLSILETADIVVHQVGDNYHFHAGNLHWLDRVAGIVCLHDVFLGGLFITWSDQGHQTEADRVLQEWYGKSLAWFYELAAEREHIAGTWPDITFTEWIASKADAIVVHSEHGLAPILRSTGGSVRIVPLAWDLRLAVERWKAPGGPHPLSILTFGTINHNKSADLVISAIAQDETLRRGSEYRLVGVVDPAVERGLTVLAEQLGVTIVLTGAVSESELARELAEADIVCCLRLPALESASASAIESLLAGKATVVADHGFYAGLPDDTVVKVDPERIATELGPAIAALAADAQAREALGARGRRYARSTFRADNYADELVSIAREVDGYRAQRELERAYGAIYAAWGAGPEDFGAVVELSRFFDEGGGTE
jgi:glycosyltransferase involved in cell wall biosynthesis